MGVLMDNELKVEAEKVSELETLLGHHKARKVIVNGEEHTIAIRQIKTGKIPKLLRAVGPLLSVFQQTVKHAKASGSKSLAELDLNELLILYGDDVLEVLAILIDKPRAFVDELEIDDSTKLLGDAIEANLDFFIQRILPSLSEGIRLLLQEVQKRKSQLQELDGQTPPVH